jgi:hypothetical protein
MKIVGSQFAHTERAFACYSNRDSDASTAVNVAAYCRGHIPHRIQADTALEHALELLNGLVVFHTNVGRLGTLAVEHRVVLAYTGDCYIIASR